MFSGLRAAISCASEQCALANPQRPRRVLLGEPRAKWAGTDCSGDLVGEPPPAGPGSRRRSIVVGRRAARIGFLEAREWPASRSGRFGAAFCATTKGSTSWVAYLRPCTWDPAVICILLSCASPPSMTSTKQACSSASPLSLLVRLALCDDTELPMAANGPRRLLNCSSRWVFYQTVAPQQFSRANSGRTQKSQRYKLSTAFAHELEIIS